MLPLVLPPNRPHHVYRGGGQIAAFRGLRFDDPFTPEDWIGSLTARRVTSTWPPSVGKACTTRGGRNMMTLSSQNPNKTTRVQATPTKYFESSQSCSQ